ncbi:MAG: type II secretion system protein GspE, partial [Pseudoalteromonas sp.]
MTNAITELNEDLAAEHAAEQITVGAELLTSDDLVELPATRLPFSYARRAGVLLSKNKEERVVFYRGELDIDVLLEVRRIAGHGFRLEQLADDKFELLLEASYQRDSSETQQMMEDIGNEVDLFSLADELPQTEDLL